MPRIDELMMDEVRQGRIAHKDARIFIATFHGLAAQSGNAEQAKNELCEWMEARAMRLRQAASAGQEQLNAVRNWTVAAAIALPGTGTALIISGMRADRWSPVEGPVLIGAGVSCAIAGTVALVLWIARLRR